MTESSHTSVVDRICCNLCKTIPNNEALRIRFSGVPLDVLFHYGIWV